VRAAGLHLEPLRHFIHLLKYQRRPDLAPELARYLAATLAGPDWQLLWPQIDAIAPVPLHAERRRQRGYDQAERIAVEAAARLRLPHVAALDRVRATTAQFDLDRRHRRTNVRGAFAVRPGERHAIRGRWVLLVDDVLTTGSTLAACAEALLEGGAAAVSAITVARER
jgi:ComF family protein